MPPRPRSSTRQSTAFRSFGSGYSTAGGWSARSSLSPSRHQHTARFDSFTRGRFGHPQEDRNITLREGARLQSFDGAFRFVGTQEQIAALIGNAVPPLLAEVIGRHVVRHLTGVGAREDAPSAIG